jgi:4-amino-4-deoxychorismate lyase
MTHCQFFESHMHPLVLINGHRDGCLSPFDRGLAYGDGVFRTFPVRRGRPCAWDLQYRKLSEDCNALGIVCPSESVLLTDILQLCADSQDIVVKIIVTRGESGRGYAVPALAQPNRVVFGSSIPDYPKSHFAEGVQLSICEMPLALQPRLAGVKHLNRLENVLARMEWVDSHFADGLMLDTEGRVVECTMSNLFFRRDRTLHTPDLSRCGVSGVTRERIMRMAPPLGYQVIIGDYAVEDVMQADEVIICNSLFGAWQVRKLETMEWPSGELASLLRDRLGAEDALVA